MRQFRESEKIDDFLDKEIIDTFFKKSVSEPKKKKKPRKKLFLYISAAVAVLVPALIITSVYVKNILSKAMERPASLYRPEYILRNGKINYFKTEKIYFDGDAKEKSAILGFTAKLVNSGSSGNASLTAVFKKPIDLTGKLLFLSGKTAEGEKNIVMVLKDIEGRFLEFPGVDLFSGWASKHIYFNNAKNNFNLKKVKELKITFGLRDTGNAPDTVIYLRDVIISSREGA